MVNGVPCKSCNCLVYLDDGEHQGICGNCKAPVEKEFVTNERLQAEADNAEEELDDENDGCD